MPSSVAGTAPYMQEGADGGTLAIGEPVTANEV
jgi:hypothetical protein